MPENELLRFELAHSSDSAPTGCGVARVGTWRPASSAERLLVPVDSGAPVLRLIPITASTDPRDLIDRQVDVILTTDPAALEYARAQSGRRWVVPLAWATTYVLILPDSGVVPVEPSDRLRAELANEVVRAEAQPAPDSGWTGSSCSVQTPRPAVRLPDIMVPAQDPVARAIAERLIALAPAGSWRRITPLARTALEAALRHPAGAAFVIPLPRWPQPDCQGVLPVAQGARLFPLVEVRTHAILGPGVPPFVIHRDGSIRFQRPS
jgi:hypothetical protein